MKELNMMEVHERLTEKIKQYISIIKDEYGSYMPIDVLNYLNSITDFSKILKIYDYGSVNAYAVEQEEICMPLCADKILNQVSKIPGYGINKNHKAYNDDNLVINNNTYLTYLTHVFISGTNAYGYYDDLLLHETMHFCGSDGSSALKEGLNELLTRMVAKKYNLRTNSCGYPKEVRLVYELMNLFGEDVVTKLAFIHDRKKEVEFLKEELGDSAAKLYLEILKVVEKEFRDKYYAHMDDFSGALGIGKKVLYYNKIDYQKAYQIIDDYKNEAKAKNTLMK